MNRRMAAIVMLLGAAPAVRATALPDLIVTALTGPASGSTAASITISNTVANVGAGNLVDECYIGFYLSTDTVVTTGDILLGNRGIYGGILPGGTNSGSANVGVPAWLAAGTYYLGAIADYDSRNAESDEGNNAFAGSSIAIQIGPDLVMTQVSGPSTGHTAAAISIDYAAANIGVGNPPDECYIGFYLSTDTVITTGDTLLGTRGIYGGFPPGTTNSGTATVNISPALAAGTYYLGAIVDVYTLNPEFSETNNALAGAPIQIQIGPDLVMTQVSGPSTGHTAAAISIDYAAANIGVGNPPDECYIGFYLSTDTVITTGDTLLGTRGIYGGFPPGTTNADAISVNLPAGLSPGIYYLGAIVDVFNVNPEFSETNNSRASDPVYLAPAARVVNREASTVSLSFSGLRVSSVYHVQRTAALLPEPTWTNTGAAITGVVSTNWSETVSEDASRAFYRLVEE
ncbi:MAG TPA: CARDB domain-containing protein [Kiritimatiellia bacterium]|nr:CARDB domain-containing protein [Kiritimatiellia bacterium]